MKRIATSVLVVVGMTASAAAHIHLTFPKSRTDLTTGDQKQQHCGVPGYVRANNPTRISTFAPGSTITVTWDETIQHPGYFRIALQPNGEVFPIPPAGAGAGGFPTEDRTGMTDAPTGTLILADAIPDGRVSMPITLPTTECANCTLQFIQVMTDNVPYTIDVNSDDIYFNCADIVIQAGATNPDPMDPGTGSGSGSGSGSDTDPGDPGDGGTVEGGCSTTSNASGLGLGFALLVGLRRRRR